MINANLLRELETVQVFKSPTGLRYVRASDIPDASRHDFEKWAVGKESPQLAGELPGDPIHEADYLEWLHSLRT